MAISNADIEAGAAGMLDAWLDGAACAGLARVMDPPLDDRTDDAREEALAVCLGCPVRYECARWVLDLPSSMTPGWVVGGMTDTQIALIRAAEGKLSEGYRRCTACQQIKALDEFQVRRTRHGGENRRPTCAECRRVERRRNYRERERSA